MPLFAGYIPCIAAMHDVEVSERYSTSIPSERDLCLFPGGTGLLDLFNQIWMPYREFSLHFGVAFESFCTDERLLIHALPDLLQYFSAPLVALFFKSIDNTTGHILTPWHDSRGPGSDGRVLGVVKQKNMTCSMAAA